MNAQTIWMALFGRRERTAEDDLREKVVTIATGLTLLRSIVTSVAFVVAIIDGSRGLLIAALAVSMVFDFLDGFVARSRHRETLVGAQLDGLADRLAACFVLVGATSMQHTETTIVTAVVVWLQFGVVDQFFSNQFLRFGLWSADHFYAIDTTVWRRTYSPIAKLASNVPVALVAIGSWCIWPAAALSIAVIGLRWSVYPMIRAEARQRVGEAGFARPARAEEPASADVDIDANFGPEGLPYPISARRLAAQHELSYP